MFDKPNKTNIISKQSLNSILFMTLVLCGCSESPKPTESVKQIEYINQPAPDNCTEILFKKPKQYARFKKSIVIDKNTSLTERRSFFSKFHRTQIDIFGQDVTKFKHNAGFTIYEAEPKIVYVDHHGDFESLKALDVSFARANGEIISAEGAPAKTTYAYNYRRVSGGWIKNKRDDQYQIDPSTIEAYLAFEFVLPNWHAEKSNLTENESLRWKEFICEVYKHERKRADITRNEILNTFNSVRYLHTDRPHKFNALLKETWEDSQTRLKDKHVKFDKLSKSRADLKL